jgi:hypothetical protein
MWIFLKSGFFSAVRHFEDNDVIHVRARFAGDLERLCEKHDVLPDVVSTPGADYLYRMDFTRADWEKILRNEAKDIDYCNFKNEVHDHTSRDAAYMRCWSALRCAQH